MHLSNGFNQVPWGAPDNSKAANQHKLLVLFECKRRFKKNGKRAEQTWYLHTLNYMATHQSITTRKFCIRIAIFTPHYSQIQSKLFQICRWRNCQTTGNRRCYLAIYLPAAWGAAPWRFSSNYGETLLFCKRQQNPNKKLTSQRYFCYEIHEEFLLMLCSNKVFKYITLYFSFSGRWRKTTTSIKNVFRCSSVGAFHVFAQKQSTSWETIPILEISLQTSCLNIFNKLG